MEVRKLTGHQNFGDDVVINQQIKEGSWRNLYVSGMNIEKMQLTLQEVYGLINAVADQIEFVFKTEA